MLVAISAAHGRHAITRAWADHTASLGFEKVVVSVTHDDQPNISYCWALQFRVLETENEPLALKFNSALVEAMNAGATRIMILPSDDFVSPAWVEAARTSEEDYIIPHTCAILDAYTQQAYRITKNALTPGATLRFGAGRVVSRKVVEACDGQLWPSELNKGLDSASHARISRAGFHAKVIETEGIPITDLKTEENLWPWSTWQGGSGPCTTEEALAMCSPSVRARIDTMKR